MTDFDLKKMLDFRPEAGLIRLADARMMLFNQGALGALRKTMYEQVGTTMAQMIFAKFGYESATRDYKTLKKFFPNHKDSDYLALGPLMHSWSGIVRVIPEVLEANPTTGHFLFKGRWSNSYEALTHLEMFGKSKSPVCYSLTGYGSGWCSQYFGETLLEIEKKCVACGDDYCEWEIRPWKDWGEEARPWQQSLTDSTLSIHAELERSIQEVKQLNASLEATVARRTAENRSQLRTLCHDLDAPIQLALSDLQQAEKKQNQANVSRAKRLLVNAEKMLGRVRKNQSLKDGKVHIQKKEFYLKYLLEDALELVAAKLLDKNIAVKISVEEKIKIFSDKDILRDHVFSNILSNAIKFSARNSTLEVNARLENKSKTLVTIKDYGIGIPQKILSEIFNPSSHTTRAGTEGEHGTGYGMPLLREHVRALGGDVWLESRTLSDDPFDHGTTVFCII